MRARSDSFDFKMKHERKVVDFAVGLSKSLDPAYSSRDISKLVFQKFGVDVSHVTINHWIHTPVPNKAKTLKRQQKKECSMSEFMSELTLFDHLLKKGFATATINPYGKVLVVPSKDFKVGWSDILKKEGHHVFTQGYQGQVAFLVAFERRVVKSPDKIVDSKNKKAFWWSSDDEKRLLKRMKEVEGVGTRNKVQNLLPEFPERTFHALLMKYIKLVKYGLTVRPLTEPLKDLPPLPTALATSSEKETALSTQLAGLDETVHEGLGLTGPENIIESLKNQLQEAQEKFLCPENLANMAATLLRHQTILFERISQTTSDEFDSEIFEDLSMIEDISICIADIHNILALKLKIQKG